MRTRLYILIMALLSTLHAGAFGYELHVPICTSQPAYGSPSAYTHATPAAYTMQSTSSSRMSSTCRNSSDLAVLGNTTGRFTTCIYGVGEEAPSAHYGVRRVRMVQDPAEPGGQGKPGSLTDVPWSVLALVVLLYCAYIARRQRKKTNG